MDIYPLQEAGTFCPPGDHFLYLSLEEFQKGHRPDRRGRPRRPNVDLYIIGPYDGLYRSPQMQYLLQRFVLECGLLLVVGPDVLNMYYEEYYSSWAHQLGVQHLLNSTAARLLGLGCRLQQATPAGSSPSIDNTTSPSAWLPVNDVTGTTGVVYANNTAAPGNYSDNGTAPSPLLNAEYAAMAYLQLLQGNRSLTAADLSIGESRRQAPCPGRHGCQACERSHRAPGMLMHLCGIYL